MLTAVPGNKLKSVFDTDADMVFCVCGSDGGVCP